MKKVLILTYFFPPANSVAANRSWSWVQHFYKHNLFPTIITRHWSGDEREWADFVSDNSTKEVFEQHEYYNIYKFPAQKLGVIRLLRKNLLRIRLISKTIYFLANYLGFLNTDADAYTSFKKGLRNHLKHHHYDLMIATSPPLNIIRLASEISKDFGIPYFIDFRDLWNNEFLREGYAPKGLQKLLEKRKLWWLKRWLKDAEMCFAVSQSIADALGVVYDGPRTVVHNGYDEFIFKSTQKVKSDTFCLSMVGTFYPMQNLELIYEGLAEFLKDKHAEKIKVRLVGISANKTIADKMRQVIPMEFAEFVDRVSREEAVQYVVNADVLLHAGWAGYKGVFTTKIFDYLASGNNILLAPGDQDVLSNLIRETETGRIADSVEEVAAILNNWYFEWKTKKNITYFGNENITFYSRENQVEILVNAVEHAMGYDLPESNVEERPLKALILSYYFPPCNGAPAWRPYSWATIFPKYNIRPTVVSRHWKGDENTWEDFIKDNTTSSTYRKEEGYEVYFLPSRKSFIVKLLRRKKTSVLALRKFVYFILNTIGHLNTEVDAYLTFRDFLKLHLKKNKYDVIIITSPPPNIARLSGLIKKYTEAKLILDFRDLWNNALLEKEYKPGLKQRYFDKLFEYYHKKWLKYPDMFTIVVDPFRDILSKHTQAPIETIYNGYEEELFRKIKKSSATRFRFTVVGTIYPKQDCTILIEGLKPFLADKKPEEVLINFIGLNSIPEVSAKISNALPKEFLNISARVSKELAIHYTVNAEVLFYPGWKGVRGIISTKAFDYIASGNKIILAPGDGDILDALIRDTKSGEIVNDEKAFESILNQWFHQWKTQGVLQGENDFTKVVTYSREQQAAKLANKIKKLVRS